ncbi:MAG: hypothetical protein ACTSU4_01090 [Promethearchaeota archaeon]
MSDEEKKGFKSSEASEDKVQKTEEKKKPVKKTQAQILQEALGLKPEDIQSIEHKLFIARFTDYFSEQPLDFIYKDKQLNSYKHELNERMNILEKRSEEDKLIKKSFEDKQIPSILDKLKQKAEELARNNGIKESFDKKMRKYSLLTTLPMFGVLILLTFLQIGNFYFIIFPLLCFFCLIPQIIRGRIMKQWFTFKEEHRNDFYMENREDIMILKGFTGDVLANLRSSLLEMKAPLQIFKFMLYSQDYENLKLITQKRMRGGGVQYYYHFEYPEGMEPFPIPEELKQAYQPRARPSAEKTSPQEPEKNFIILTEMKGKDGVISSFVPALKDNLAEKINNVLNDSEFQKISKKITEIIPAYSEEMAIYCKCGEIVEIEDIHESTWKDQFKFYLFEGAPCKCGEKIYALSKMDEKVEVPGELKDVFED